MKLTVLGSGSPEAYARRASSGFLVEVGEDKILFDCGGGVVDNLIRSGRLPKDITHLFFTHYHSDHMMDYARLVHAAWDEGAAPLKVFGPPPLREISDGYFGRNGVLKNDLRARTELPQSQQVWVARGGVLPRPWPAPEVTEISAGDVISMNGWKVTAARATHAQPFLDCLGFSLEAEGKKFVYSGDTGINPDITALCQNADFLLHWCYRGVGEELHPALLEMSPDPSEIAEMAKSVGVKYLALSHFRIHMDAAENHARTSEVLTGSFGSNWAVVEDLDQFTIC